MSPRCNTPFCLPRAVIPMQRVVFALTRARWRKGRLEDFDPTTGQCNGEYNREAQRGNKTGNNREKWKVEKKKPLDCAPRCFTKHFIEMTERSFHRGFPLPVVFPYCGPRCTTPFLGRSPRANRWKNDDLGFVPILKKQYFTKIRDFPFFPSIYIQTVY